MLGAPDWLFYLDTFRERTREGGCCGLPHPQMFSGFLMSVPHKSSSCTLDSSQGYLECGELSVFYTQLQPVGLIDFFGSLRQSEERIGEGVVVHSLQFQT